ncbi:MAG: hypothetical protein JRI25_24235 [Deltaproteobacteria bacterium]|nr:hypothetical protein [Deltaproteobacteria bacterium]MBW2257686.1 hypothetical protein [Deltaproteobacteria bacterium]
MGGKSQSTPSQAAPQPAGPATPSPTSDRSHLAPIDELVGGEVDGNSAAAEALRREDSPMSRRQADLELANRYGPVRRRELELDVANAWGPSDEREVDVLRAQATAEGVDPDVALLLETRADLMEEAGQDRLARAEAALAAFEEESAAHGLH